jgi:hypothetical protein
VNPNDIGQYGILGLMCLGIAWVVRRVFTHTIPEGMGRLDSAMLRRDRLQHRMHRDNREDHLQQNMRLERLRESVDKLTASINHLIITLASRPIQEGSEEKT